MYNSKGHRIVEPTGSILGINNQLKNRVRDLNDKRGKIDSILRKWSERGHKGNIKIQFNGQIVDKITVEYDI